MLGQDFGPGFRDFSSVLNNHASVGPFGEERNLKFIPVLTLDKSQANKQPLEPLSTSWLA